MSFSVFPNCMDSYQFSPFKDRLNDSFKKQATLYCDCAKEPKVKDWISEAYKPKNKKLMKKDLCASKFFKGENLEIHYIVKYEEYYVPKILSKLKEISNPSTPMIAGDKWASYQQCFIDKVSSDCSKIQSLTNTNYCINESFEIDSFYQNHDYCTNIKIVKMKKEELI